MRYAFFKPRGSNNRVAYSIDFLRIDDVGRILANRVPGVLQIGSFKRVSRSQVKLNLIIVDDINTDKTLCTDQSRSSCKIPEINWLRMHY